jgi:hypothetical protein
MQYLGGQEQIFSDSNVLAVVMFILCLYFCPVASKIPIA